MGKIKQALTLIPSVALLNFVCVVLLWLFIIWKGGVPYGEAGFLLLLGLILLLSAAQLIWGVTLFFKGRKVAGALTFLAAPLFAFLGVVPAILGAAWGRPLRVRGQQIHAELTEGSEWTRGDHPDVSNLDQATRAALEALWLHDAQKEHASVPAFSRISWILTAVGAPAEIVEWSHQAAIEEIEHARLCFALAEGYGGRSYTVEPIPDLLIDGLQIQENPLVILATESLLDGCQLEDFNADVAAKCSRTCEDAVTKNVLAKIAREERSHAEFSWALLSWLLNKSPHLIIPEIKESIVKIDTIARPTAIGSNLTSIISQANREQMLKHGRIPDTEWQLLWDARLEKTKQRLDAMIKDGVY